MPRQNRVTPFGDIVATAARGTRMGNRGVLHNKLGEITRPFRNQAWIICQLEFKNQKLPLMEAGHYTQLFFLDEATAFAAGHRPCAYCQRARFNEFRAAWIAGNSELDIPPKPLVKHIDAILHGERIHLTQTKVTYIAHADELPNGTFVSVQPNEAALVWDKVLWIWSSNGYTHQVACPKNIKVQVLTPRSIVHAFQHGFVPDVHNSMAT